MKSSGRSAFENHRFDQLYHIHNTGLGISRDLAAGGIPIKSTFGFVFHIEEAATSLSFVGAARHRAVMAGVPRH